jgi:hypothetical protein
MKCPNCGYEEGNHAVKLSDEEYFMEIWTPTLGLEEAKKSWLEKQNQPRQLTHMVMSDIDGYVSQVDGSWIKSRSQHRSHLKQHKMIELGNDVPQQHKAIEVNQKSNEARKRQIAELAYAKLNYR